MQDGTLPQVSWIAAPEAFSEHPNWPANYDVWYIDQVLQVLTSNPEMWGKTAMFITYNENDGFLDHLVPPFAPSGGSDLSTVGTASKYFPDNSMCGAGSYGLGQYVLMLVISPWSKGGYVCSETFDHTSIIHFIKQRFKRTHSVRSPNISKWCRAVCGDLTSASNFTTPSEVVPALPNTTAYIPKDRLCHASYVPLPPLVQAVPEQEAGVRASCMPSYGLFVCGCQDEAVSKSQLESMNTGDVGATFLVYTAGSTDAPRTYTIEAGRRLPDKLAVNAGGAYNFTVRGSSGFLRYSVGKLTLSGLLSPHGRALEVKGDYDVASDNLQLRLINHGHAPTVFTIKSTYTGENVQRGVRSGGDASVYLDPHSHHAWYDLTITANADAGFARRLADYIETGHVNVSDPALSA